MAEPIGALRALLSLDWASFEQATKDAAKATNNFGKTFKSLNRDLEQSGRAIASIAAPVGAAMAAVGAAIAVATYKLIDQSSALVDLSDQSGHTVEWLERTGFAASQAGTSLETLAASSKKLEQALGEGSANSVEAVNALGLSFAELRQASPDEAMQKVLVALGKIPNHAQQTAVAMRLLGKSGTELIPLAGDIEALQRRAEELGLVMGDQSRRNAESLGDFIDALQSAFGGLSNQLASLVTDNASVHALINGLADVFGTLSGKVKDNKGELSNWVTGGAIMAADGLITLSKASGIASTAWDALQLVWRGAYHIGLELALLLQKGFIGWGKQTEAQKAARAETEAMIRAIEGEIAANSEGANKAIEAGQKRQAAIAVVTAELEKLKQSVAAAAGKNLELEGSHQRATGAATLQTDADKKLNAELLKMEDAARRVQFAQEDAWLEASRLFAQVQADITEANLVGVDQRLFQIDREREAALASLQQYAFAFPALYAQLVLVVQQKYAQMTAAAQGHYSTIQQAAAAAGFQTQAELQAEADRTRSLYEQMLASGLYSVETLRQAKERAAKAQEKIDGIEKKSALEKYQMISSAASSALRSIFGKNKTAAIAAAIVDTAAAVVSTFRNAGGWPWGLIPAAAMAAAGYAQIQQIRSQDAGFAEGTPGTSFVDFGRETWRPLHGMEAVVNQKQGKSLASLLAGTVRGSMRRLLLPGGGVAPSGTPDTASLAELRALRDEQRAFRAALPTVLRDAVMMARA